MQVGILIDFPNSSPLIYLHFRFERVNRKLPIAITFGIEKECLIFFMVVINSLYFIIILLFIFLLPWYAFSFCYTLDCCISIIYIFWQVTSMTDIKWSESIDYFYELNYFDSISFCEYLLWFLSTVLLLRSVHGIVRGGTFLLLNLVVVIILNPII
jgi:hypothetical protein